MSKKKRQVEIISWIDAVSQDDWSSIESIHSCGAEVESVGFYLCETEQVVTIALNIDLSSNNAACVMHIPKGMIRHRKKLKI